MINPFEPPKSAQPETEPNEPKMSLEDYWRRVRFYRYAVYANFFLILTLGLTWEVLSQFTGNTFSDLTLQLSAIALLVSQAFFGYRLTSTKCYQCGYKLISGQFFRMKKIKCFRCGFKYGDS